MRLRTRFLLVLGSLYVAVVVISICFFYSISSSLIYDFASRFAAKEVLIQKNRLANLVEKEILISRRLADDAVVLNWVQNEFDQDAYRRSKIQIDGYRKLVHDQEVFISIASSRHYYTFGESTVNRETLDLKNSENAWFTKAMQNIEDFELNTDQDLLIHRTKVWINTVLRDNLRVKSGIVGTGIDLTVILDEIIDKQEPGITVFYIDEQGVIQAAKDRSIVMHNVQKKNTDKITIYDMIKDQSSVQALHKAIQGFHSVSANEADELSLDSHYVTLPMAVDGERRVAAISFMKHLGWYSVVIVDVGQAISNKEFLPFLIVLFISILILALAMGYLLNRMVLVPLSGLTVATEEMAAGKYDIQVEVRHDDEIGRLTQSFNEMAKMIDGYTHDLEAKVKQRTKELTLANQSLKKSQQEIDESIRYGALIQASILPGVEMMQSVFRDHFVLFRPKMIVGGDFYFMRKTDDAVLLAVVDCTGHGVPGAFMTMAAASVLRSICSQYTDWQPGSILTEMNESLKETLHFQGIDAGLDIALVVIDRRTKLLKFAGAGLSLYELKADNITEYHGDMQRVGYRTSKIDFAYKETVIDASSDCVFYMTSDGILDEPGGTKGYGFGRTRFLEMLEKYGHLSLTQQKELVQRSIDEYRGQNLQRDDQTLIGFCV